MQSEVKKIIFGMILCIFLLASVSALTLKQNTTSDINLVCINAGYCSAAAECNVSVFAPNEEVILDGVTATQSASLAFHNITLNSTQTSQLGEYQVGGFCKDGSVTQLVDFTFDVTHSGGVLKEGSTSILIMAIIFMLVIGALCLFGFFRKDQNFQTKWTLFLVSFIFFLSGANLISTLIGDTLANPNVVSFFDSFMAISFILFWFAFGLLAVMWFLTILQTILFNKKKSDIERFGRL